MSAFFVCNFSIGIPRYGLMFFLPDLADVHISLVCIHVKIFGDESIGSIFNHNIIITHMCAKFWSYAADACSRNFNGMRGRRNV